MANDNELVSSISIMQNDGSYETRPLKVQGENVIGTVDKSTKDKNGKDITTYIAEISKSANGISIGNGAGTSSSVNLSMTGASSKAAGASGFVPAPLIGEQNYFLKGNGTWANGDYTGQDGVEVNSGNRVIKLESLSSLVPGTYGPDTDITGSNGVTIEIPEVTVDEFGRITGITTHTLTNQNTTYTNGEGITLIGTTFGLDNHASATEAFGTASSAFYGHVKISDTYKSEIEGNGIAASQNGLHSAYIELSESISEVAADVAGLTNDVDIMTHVSSLPTDPDSRTLYLCDS